MAWFEGASELPRIEAGEFVFRPVAPADVDALFEIFGDAETMRFWSHAALTDRAAAADYYRSILSGFESRTLFQWGLARAEGGALIGTGTLCNLEAEHGRAEIGYALARREWGRGVMTRALPALLRFAFEELGLRRIEADVDPRNPGSYRLLERFGFVREGERRESYVVGGEIQDAWTYGLLRREFRG